ncbi:MAG: M13 family metallopeptidase [Deltaproteobacteria bacterium]|nr:M13 family metallopeptidase [Deltaproteobacteria bacterium]
MTLVRRTSSSVALGATALLVACAPPPQAPKSGGPRVKAVSLAEIGLDSQALDRSADPCVDFYQFACGNWIKNTAIPGDQPRWMRSFSEIQKRNEEDLREILERLAASGATADERKLGDYYASCVDEAAIERGGLEPVKPLLARIEQLRRVRLVERAGARSGTSAAKGKGSTKGKALPETEAPTQVAAETLERLIADMHRAGLHPLFSITSGPDDKDATTMIAHADQDGLGLPDRDYYLDAKYADVLAYYQGHVAAMLRLAGLGADESTRAAEQVVKLEKALASISKTRVERRDPQGMYNRIDRAGLSERSKRFDYQAYLDALAERAQYPTLGVTKFTKINVTSVAFFNGLNTVLADASPEELASYLRWHVLHGMSDALPKAFDEEGFRLVQKITGQKEQKPRWKRCVASVDTSLGELLGKSYVAKRFLPESKEDVRSMLKAIRDALDKRLPALTWMDDATRAQAKAKLVKMEYLVGYPDRWLDYPFAVERTAYGRNVLGAAAYDFERRLAKVERPVDRGEWYMPPQTVNAYYDPNKNQMVFPAGILQPPFYSPKASLAVNLGSIGMVVGHELTHGFDDQGSQYDGDGNLRSWWQPDVRKQFDERAGCIDEQYAGYEVLPGVKQNGKLTLGENIADNAGLMLAYMALTAMREGAGEVLNAEGFDERQQLFLSLGQVWCSKQTDELTKLRAATDPHSHPRWRVNGSVRNLPAFAEAFQCTEGTAMRPKTSCTVW